MTVTGMSPTVAMPGLVPTAATNVAGQSPAGYVMPGAMSALPTAAAMPQGVNSAMLGAMPQGVGGMDLASLLGASMNPTANPTGALGMQAAPASAAVATPAAVATAKAKVTKPKAKTTKPKPKTAGAKAKASAAKPKPAAPKPAAVAPAAAGTVAGSLPANATQLPGGTVYSFADANNAGLQGLAGLSPQQQLALGIMPNSQALGMQGLTGEGRAQSNITNQSSMGGTGTNGLLGLGGLGLGLGAQVPTLGAPILGNTNLSPTTTTTTPSTSTTPGAPAAPTNGGAQSVTNRNANDNGSYNRGVDPFGYGAYGAMPYGGYGGYGYSQLPYGGVPYSGAMYGAMPYLPNGGVASPTTPYGASMTGAGILAPAPSGGIKGFFARLFG